MWLASALRMQPLRTALSSCRQDTHKDLCMQSKVKGARYSGNDSGSEDYEVDDNGMVEKQMRELGVDVIMHHTMVEDLSLIHI